MNTLTVNILCILSIGIFLSGCSITDNVTYEDMEGQIPASLFEDIKKKRVSTQEVVQQLGEPVLIETLDENIKVMTYRFNRVQIRNWRMLFFLRSGSRQEDLSYFHVAYLEDNIKKTWVDDSLRIQKYHKLVQEVDPPVKEKSSGINWKIPFFSSKENEKQKTTVNNQPAPQENAMNQMQQSSESTASDSETASGPDASSSTADKPEDPEVNDDAFKVDLTL